MALNKVRSGQIQPLSITKELINVNVAGTGLKQGEDGSLQVFVKANSGIVTDGTSVYIDYYKDIPSGAADGTNVTFTLTNTPVTNYEQVFLNGILQESGIGNDYTIATKTVTFGLAPRSGDKVRANYIVASRP
jgi:hypothetical protein